MYSRIEIIVEKGEKSRNTENAHHDTILLSGEHCLACAMQQMEVHLALKEATDFGTGITVLDCRGTCSNHVEHCTLYLYKYTNRHPLI